MLKENLNKLYIISESIKIIIRHAFSNTTIMATKNQVFINLNILLYLCFTRLKSEIINALMIYSLLVRKYCNYVPVVVELQCRLASM